MIHASRLHGHCDELLPPPLSRLSILEKIKMTQRQTPASAAAAPHAAQAPSLPRADGPRRGHNDAYSQAPLRLYSVFLLGAFAMKPGPARGGKG